MGRLDLVDKDLVGAWLSERQLPNGGLNGRPEKLEDVSVDEVYSGKAELRGEKGMLFVVEPRGSEYCREITLDQPG